MFKIKPFIFRSLLVVCFAIVGVVAAQSTQAAYWEIESFDSLIEIQEDATIDVTETIEVNFDIEKHGIYRDIPVVYQDPLGNRVRANVTNIEVFQDGQPVQYKISRIGSWKDIRIGDPDVVITGHHTYEIHYTVHRALLYFDDRDQLYWNVTGDAWEVEIPKSSAGIVLPDGAEVIEAACYTGYYGSADQDCGIAQDGQLIAFAAEDFLTIAVDFTKGTVYEPTMLMRVWWFMTDNWLGLIPVLLIIGTFYLWWRMGRDPKLHKTVIAEYEPPEGLLAPYVGLLLTSTVTKQAITAMIIQLAVMGYLTIEVDDAKRKRDREVTLIKKKSSGDLDLAHTKLMTLLFGSKGESVTLKELRKKVTSLDITGIRKALLDHMKQKKLFTSSSFKLGPGIIVLSVFQLFLAMMLGAYFGVFTGAMFAASGIIGIVFGLFMPKRTLKGAELARHAAGFKLFMHTAERYRSVWQEKQHIFFDFLPYAIVFKDTKHWAKVFEGLDFDNPDWYHGNIPLTSSSLALSEISSFSKSFATASTPPSTSSGGGTSGGFSGGGFGGGGGGSW